jgi:YVTN family beta-propeller protein
VDADGKRAYTANVGSDNVSVIDLAAGKVVGTVKVGRRPYAVALAAGKGFVTDQYGGTVTVFDLATLAVIKTIEVGEYPEGIEADPTGEAVYVACWEANTLERIDTATLEVTARIPVGDGPRAFGLFLR